MHVSSYYIHAVASLGLMTPGVVIAAAKIFIFNLFKMKNIAIFNLLLKKLNTSPKVSDDLFSFFAQKHVVYHTKFPIYLFLAILPKQFIFLPFYPQNLLIFSSWCHALRWCHPRRPVPTSRRHCIHAHRLSYMFMCRCAVHTYNCVLKQQCMHAYIYTYR